MKQMLGRILSFIGFGLFSLLAGARLVLDLIGYSTAPDDIAKAQTLLHKSIEYFLTIPWWAPLGIALIAMVLLIYVSWPRPAPSAQTQEDKSGHISSEGQIDVQPRVQLVPPDERHQVVWDPNVSNAIWYDREGQISANEFNLPIFHLRTTDGASVQDASVEWKINSSSLDGVIATSNRLSRYQVEFEDNIFVIKNPETKQRPHQFSLKHKQKFPVPFITNAFPGVETHPYLRVFENILIYIIACMPEAQGSAPEPIVFTVFVRWNLPTQGSQQFQVKTSFVNAKPHNLPSPEVDVFLSFTVEDID